MMGSFGRLSSVALVLCGATCLWSGCKGEQAGRVLRDTEGRAFSAECPPQGECKLEQTAGPERVELPGQVLLVGGRLVGVCDVKPGEAPKGPMDCRPLVCEKDADCPPAHGMKDGQCLNKRCSDPAEPIGIQDAIILCMSGTGLGHDKQEQVERYAMALNCGKPCKIPAPCPLL
jgi:hypothetical protein